MVSFKTVSRAPNEGNNLANINLDMRHVSGYGSG